MYGDRQGVGVGRRNFSHSMLKRFVFVVAYWVGFEYSYPVTPQLDVDVEKSEASSSL